MIDNIKKLLFSIIVALIICLGIGFIAIFSIDYYRYRNRVIDNKIQVDTIYIQKIDSIETIVKEKEYVIKIQKEEIRNAIEQSITDDDSMVVVRFTELVSR